MKQEPMKNYSEIENSPNPPVKKRGRPKDTALRARILTTAREMFLEHGFQAVSVDSIAAAAQVSNRTVFSHFHSKDQLLWAIIVAEGESLRPQLIEELPTSLRQYRQCLTDFGIGLVTLLTTPTIIRLGNLMLSESSRHPEMAKTFYQWGPGMTRRTVVEWIEHGKSQRWLAPSTPSHAGDHLLALWQGTWHLPQQLGIQGKLTRPRIEAHVKECVDLFMRAYQN